MKKPKIMQSMKSQMNFINIKWPKEAWAKTWHSTSQVPRWNLYLKCARYPPFKSWRAMLWNVRAVFYSLTLAIAEEVYSLNRWKKRILMTILMKRFKIMSAKAVGPQVTMRVLTLFPTKVRVLAKVASVRQLRMKNRMYFSKNQEPHKWCSTEGPRCCTKL